MGLLHRQVGYGLLQGEGLEIGALHEPAVLSSECRVQYLDIADEKTLQNNFRELDGQSITTPDWIGDIGLSPISDITGRTFDFVIMNHVLEHTANPIQVIKNIWQGIHPGGLFILSIPDKRFTFDNKRSLTTWEHLLADYHLEVADVHDDHYVDFLANVHPQVFDSKEAFIDAVRNVRNRHEHAHVWDSDSFDIFLSRTFKLLGKDFSTLYRCIGNNTNLEYFCVIGKPPCISRDEILMKVLMGIWLEREDLRNAFPDFAQGNMSSLISWASVAKEAGDSSAFIVNQYNNELSNYYKS